MIKKSTFCTNEVTIKRFTTFVEANRLAHAYLLIGPKKIGKTQTALEIAKLVNCETAHESRPCGVCASCVKINSGNHPDLHIIAKEGESIKIDDIRALLSRSQLRAFEAKKKVFILHNIETLTAEAANALLRTLEEPGPQCLWLLMTSLPEKVILTIKSRCQAVYFFPADPRQLKEKLQAEQKQSQEIAHFFAYACEGCPGKIADENFQKILTRKNRCIDEFVFSLDSEQYLKEVSKDKAQVKEILWFLFCWFKDLLLVKQGVGPEQLVHLDRHSDLEALKEKYLFHHIEQILKSIVSVSRAVDENFNVKISLALLKETIWRK